MAARRHHLDNPALAKMDVKPLLNSPSILSSMTQQQPPVASGVAGCVHGTARSALRRRRMAFFAGDAVELMWEPWMRRALQLAALADGHTSPNPLVGAVVLDSGGALVGEGFMPVPASPTLKGALAQARDRARGGTWW